MSTPNTIPLTYNGYVAAVAILAVEDTETVGGVAQGVDASFNTVLPQALNYAEQRIQRDLDLIGLEFVDSTSYTLTAGSDTLSVDVNEFAIPRTFVVNGVPCLPVTRQFLQNVYGPGSTNGQPIYVAPGGGDQLSGGAVSLNYLFGPIPDQNYPVTISGLQWMPSLAKNATLSLADTAVTLISAYLPDLLVMASMIYISGFQRDFGAQMDDADQAVTYETQYQALLKGALDVGYRQRFEAAGWTAESTSPVGTPNR